jgi:hypothetical protein
MQKKASNFRKVEGGKMRYCTKRLKNKLIEIVNKKITSRRIRTSAQINLTTLFYNKMN